jgi:hypothetical protein
MIIETTGNQFAAHIDKLFDKCVLYWPGSLETQSGFSIVPSGCTVTPNGTWDYITLPNGKTAKHFDGATNYINISDNAAWFFGTEPFSILFWIYIQNATLAQYVWSQRTDGNNEHQSRIYNNSISWNNYHSGAYQWSFNNSITTGWHHITLVRGGSSQKMYIDAVLGANQGTSASAVNDYAGPWTLGYLTNYGGYFGGSLKDFMIFRRALSIADIRYIMDRTNPYRYGAGLNYPLLYKR